MDRLISSSAVRLVGLVLIVEAVFLASAPMGVLTGRPGLSAAMVGLDQTVLHLSDELFNSGEHPNATVSELGDLSRAMILNEERIVLLDGRTLLFVNPWTGELWTAGGEGEGPGEFAGSGLLLGLFRAQDEIIVWDPNIGRRLTTFSDTGELVDARRIDLSGVAFRHWTANMMGVFADGNYAFRDREPPGASDDKQGTLAYVVEVSEEGNRREIAEFPDGQAGSVLFGHSTIVSFGGDRVSVTDTESDEIRIVDRSGRVVSGIPMPGERVRVSRAQVDAARDAAQAYRRHSDEMVARQLESIGLPSEGARSSEPDYTYNEIAPPVDVTKFDADQRLWIRHYVLPGDETIRWTVWDGGENTFSLEMPANYELLDARGDLVLLSVQDSLGVDRALIRRLVGFPVSGSSCQKRIQVDRRSGGGSTWWSMSRYW